MFFKKSNWFFLSFLLLLFSCSEKYEVNFGDSGIFITHNSSTQVVGKDTHIRVFTDDGEEITEEAVIYVNNQQILGNTFTADEPGFYEVTALYHNLSSTALYIEYHDGSEVNFKKRVLVEDYTGTWCGWCPRVSHGMKLVDQITENVVFVAIHRAPVGTSDPYNYTNAESLEQLINTPGYPKGFINRVHQWSFPEPSNIKQVMEFTQGSNPKLGLALNSSVENNTISAQVKVGFAKNFDNLKLVVQLLENGLVYPQVNYTDYYNGENPIADYVHNYTLRKTLTNILGDEIPNTESKIDGHWEKNLEFEVPSSVTDITQLDIVAFVVDQNNEVVNVRKANLGEQQSFEIE